LPAPSHSEPWLYQLAGVTVNLCIETGLIAFFLKFLFRNVLVLLKILINKYCKESMVFSAAEWRQFRHKNASLEIIIVTIHKSHVN